MTHLWRCRDRLFEIGPRALVMGIVNVTPDSFSDGGRFNAASAAVAHALRLAEEGADILDIGGESSRPGATPVPVEEELARVVPVVCELTKRVPTAISVDTVKAEVARQAIAAGACIINDISALRGDNEMADVVRASGAGVVLMHMQGNPQTMQLNPTYHDVVAEIGEFFDERMRQARAFGIDPQTIALDPGIGFGKSLEHNLELIRRMSEYQCFGRPVCLGISRKGILGQIIDKPRDQRMAASLATACFAIVRGGAQIVRVHDVAAHRDAVKIIAALTI